MFVKAEMIVHVVAHAKEREIEILRWKIPTDYFTNDCWDVCGDCADSWLWVVGYCDCDWLGGCVDGGG